MKKIFTSLIVLSLLLIAVVFTNAAVPKNSSSEKQMKICLAIVSGDVPVSALIGAMSQISQPEIGSDSSHFSIARIAMEAIGKSAFDLEANGSFVERENRTAEHQPPQPSMKPDVQNFYDLPPNDFGYTGLSFANLIRARPVLHL